MNIVNAFEKSNNDEYIFLTVIFFLAISDVYWM